MIGAWECLKEIGTKLDYELYDVPTLPQLLGEQAPPILDDFRVLVARTARPSGPGSVASSLVDKYVTVSTWPP